MFDEPLLMAEGQRLPLASIVVVKIKRPMRNDAASGEDKDPIEQALGYLDRIRNGQTQTASGRPIPRSDEIPGFCYVICDITPSVEKRCKLAQLTVTSDRQGYFGDRLRPSARDTLLQMRQDLLLEPRIALQPTLIWSMMKPNPF